MFWREHYLLRKLDSRNIPSHIAIIMDGNGRWASKKGLPRLEGHRAGTRSVRRAIEAGIRAGVEYLTLYSFSQENWQRPADEIAGLMDLFEEMLETETPELNRQGVRVLTIGLLDELRPSTRDRFMEAQEATKHNTKITMMLAVNYGGRREIVDAAVRMAAAGKSPATQGSDAFEEFTRYLYRPEIPDPDLIIRTSGEMRLSNFLLWQAAYSEFWITGKLWPDMRRSDFYRAIYDYQRRDRRFGGL